MNHPATDHEENGVEHYYMELQSLPTENGGTEHESGAYDIPVLDHNETGAPASTELT